MTILQAGEDRRAQLSAARMECAPGICRTGNIISIMTKS